MITFATLSKYIGFKNIKDSDRTKLTRKSIIISLLLRPFSVLIGYLMVSVTLGYLDSERYGIWLTISSIIGWVYLFDVGIGNGLRNNLTKALARHDYELAREYISTSYALMSIISFLILIIFFIIYNLLDWSVILNTPKSMEEELKILVFWVVVINVLRFIIMLINMIFNSIQKPFYNDILNFVVGALSLIVIFLLTKFFTSSLLLFGISLSVISVIILAIVTIRFFSRNGKNIRPSIKYIRFDNVGEIVSLGFKFFILQIGVIIIFATDNIIIAQLYGPEEVTKYNIAFKYFNSVSMLSGVFLTPLWSAFTNAFESKDYDWIKGAIKKSTKFFYAACLLVIIMIFIADYFYLVWVGKEIIIPLNLTIFMGFFVLISLWDNIFVYFLNGVGKIKLQLYITIFITILNIPLAVFFAKYLNLGIGGVILSSVVCLIPSAILFPIQYSKIMQNKARGIFDK